MCALPNKAVTGEAGETAIHGKLVCSDASRLRDWWLTSRAERWGLPAERFGAELGRCVNGKFHAVVPSYEQVCSHIGTLHLEDLALACACADGVAEAWEYFVATYRGYLRACAGSMLKRPATAPEAEELADSLFADLYGLSAEKRGKLFRYFHGRSSLKTWLRAVLAQRHVDKIRTGRKFEELPEDDRGDGAAVLAPPASAALLAPLHDPHRERYLRLFTAALNTALQNLEARDAQRLRMYYAEEKKLAEIGRAFGEHESSASRNLERIRRELRGAVEKILRTGSGAELADGQSGAGGLSDAQIALCYEYASQDAPIDLETLLSKGKRSQADDARDSGVIGRSEEAGKGL
jgi:RNA polymerase sigma factor (sigma-70 family)